MARPLTVGAPLNLGASEYALRQAHSVRGGGNRPATSSSQHSPALLRAVVSLHAHDSEMPPECPTGDPHREPGSLPDTQLLVQATGQTRVRIFTKYLQCPRRVRRLTSVYLLGKPAPK